MKFRLAGVLGALVLAGCASKGALESQVQRGMDDGAKTVAVPAQPVVCAQPYRCPVLGASWSGAKPGQAVLTVGLPHQAGEVSGADFHFGSGEMVRVRSRSRTAAPALGYPATAFDVPLRLVDRIAYTPRSWMRVYTADGLTVDETINSGAEDSKAAEALGYFLTAVEAAAGGKAQGAQGSRGGLFERLGGGGDK